MTAFTGTLTTNVPAADLDGSAEVPVSGEEAEIIDLTTRLDTDEVFMPLRVSHGIQLAPGRTSTNESYIEIETQLRGESARPEPGEAYRFTAAPVDAEQGIADIYRASAEVDDCLTHAKLSAVQKSQDASTGVGSGPHFAEERIVLDPEAMEHAGREAYDADDSLYVPHKLLITGVADHFVRAHQTVVVRGPVVEV